MNRSSQFLTTFVIITCTAALLYFLMPAIMSNELAARVIPVIFVVVGVAILIGVGVTANRYKDVIDYEPITFLGRATNGKGVRSVINTVGMIGCMSVVVGVTVFLLIGYFLAGSGN